MARGISAEAREDILVQAFLTCPNISEISKKTKIPGPTIYTVIHTDSFQRKYSEARNEAVTGAIAYLQGKLGECAAVLVNTATDTEVPAQIRVNAANAALSQCSQWTKNVDNEDGSICAHVPVSWLRISPPRQYTEEQRQQMGERLRQNRSENTATQG